MARPVHFEIPADDVQRACDFYSQVFGWVFEDWSEFYGRPYVGIITGAEGEPGINGAIAARVVPGGPGIVLTITCSSISALRPHILIAGGTAEGETYPLRGVGWQARFVDTEGNHFILHEDDPTAA